MTAPLQPATPVESIGTPLLIARAASPASGIVERFLWTFVQAGIGSLPATVSLTGHTLAAVGYSALTAGIAAVISLAKSLAIKAQTGA